MSTAPPMMTQKAYRKHMAFCEAHPEWSKRAVDVMNRWGTGEVTLAQSIAEALIQAHADGKEGVEVQGTQAKSKVLRRTR